MEWLKTLLKNAGVEESKIDGIVTDFNKEVPKHLIPKDKYNELSEKTKKLEGDITQRDKQIEDLGKMAGASEDLKKQIQQLQDENKTAKEKYEAELKDLTLTNAIKSALAGKVHDESLVAGLFDRARLVIDGDKVVGLDDQLKTLQESKAFLFKSEEGQGQGQQAGFRIGGDGQGSGQGGSADPFVAALGLKK
ncbi:phage scaffolding protein [Paenibacillus cisolokensis]|uniref:phage scaffolding protein n=1 Tax=Paenibacillus cisolokensis TaxID=1658519 RepID=UPI003D2E59B0